MTFAALIFWLLVAAVALWVLGKVPGLGSVLSCRARRMADETKALLKYLKKTSPAERGAMAKILTGKDDAESRRYLTTRVASLKQREFIRERLDGAPRRPLAPRPLRAASRQRPSNVSCARNSFELLEARAHSWAARRDCQGRTARTPRGRRGCGRSARPSCPARRDAALCPCCETSPWPSGNPRDGGYIMGNSFHRRTSARCRGARCGDAPG